MTAQRVAVEPLDVTPAHRGGQPGTEVRSLVVRGLAWKGLSQVVLQVGRLAVAVAIARLLTPHEYGVAMMALAFSSLGLVFSDLALGAALIQRRTLTQDDRSTAFWTSVAAGVLFSLVGIAVAGIVADFYGEPQVQSLFIVLSLGFFVVSLGVTQEALLSREMSFRSLEIRMMAGMMCGAVAGIAFAASGFGAWSIVAQQLTTVTTSTVLIWFLSPWRPNLRYSLQSVRELGAFTAKVFCQRLLYYSTRNADTLIIGRSLGAASVGVYTLAYNVMLVPLSRLGIPVQEVLFPALSRIQDERERVGQVWLRVNRVIAAISVPSLLGLIVVAPEFVDVVLGQRWASAVPVIQILAWVGVLQAVQNLNGEVLQARNRSGIALGYMVLWSGVSIVAFVIGLQWGILGVAACFAVSSTLLAPISIWLTGREVGVSLRRFVGALAGVLEAAVLSAILVFAARQLLLATDLHSAARLGLLVSAGVAAYVPLLAWRSRDVLDDLRRLRTR